MNSMISVKTKCSIVFHSPHFVCVRFPISYNFRLSLFVLLGPFIHKSPTIVASGCLSRNASRAQRPRHLSRRLLSLWIMHQFPRYAFLPIIKQSTHKIRKWPKQTIKQNCYVRIKQKCLFIKNGSTM